MAITNFARLMGRSTASRKVVTYRKATFTGFYPSRKNNRMVQYESLLERDFIVLAEADPRIQTYTEQPSPLWWTDGVRTYRTTFDFAITLSGNRKYLVEVKPLEKVLKYSLDHLYGFARAAARKRGYTGLELWTDREIRAYPRLPNADLVAASRTSYVDLSHELAMRSAIAKLAQQTKQFSIKSLRAASNLGAASFRMVIRLIAGGELLPVSQAAPLDDHALLTISNADREAIPLVPSHTGIEG